MNDKGDFKLVLNRSDCDSFVSFVLNELFSICEFD